MRAFSGRVGWDIRMLWSAFLKLLKPARLWCRLGCVWKALGWSLPLQSTRQCAEQSFLMVSSDWKSKRNTEISLRWRFSQSKFESYQFSSSAVWGWRLLWQRCQRCLRAHTEEKCIKIRSLFQMKHLCSQVDRCEPINILIRWTDLKSGRGFNFHVRLK